MWWSYFDTFFSTCIKFSMFFNLALTFYLQANHRILQMFYFCNTMFYKIKNCQHNRNINKWRCSYLENLPHSYYYNKSSDTYFFQQTFLKHPLLQRQEPLYPNKILNSNRHLFIFNLPPVFRKV